VRVGIDDPLTGADDPAPAIYTATADSIVITLGTVSGARVNADATITGTADAFIGAPTGIAAGGAAGTDLSITGAINIATLSKMYAVANANGTGGGLVTVGVMLPSADVAGTARAYIGAGADVFAGSVNVSANAIEWKANATTVSVGIGGVSGQGADADAKVTGTVDAHIGTQSGAAAITTTVNAGSGAVAVTASSVMIADALANGAAFGLVGAIAVMTPSATVSGKTRAYVGDGATVNAGSLKVIANSSNMYAEATTDALQIALFGSGSGLVANATVSGIVESFIGAQAAFVSSLTPGTINVGSGTVIVESGSSMEAYAKADSTNGSLLTAIALLFPTATVSGITRSYVRDGVDVTAGYMRVRVGIDDPATIADDPAPAVLRSRAESVVFALGTVSDALIYASANTTGTVAAFVGAPSTITAGGAGSTDLSVGTIDVTTLSKMYATSTADGTSAGLVAVGVMLPSASVSGHADAYLGAGNDINGTTVNVTADMVEAKAESPARARTRTRRRWRSRRRSSMAPSPSAAR